MMKACIACKRMKPKEDFRNGRNVCKNCISLQQYNPEEFKKKYPNYIGRTKEKRFQDYGRIPISDPAHPQHNLKYSLKYKPPPPPDDIILCLNVLDDNLSKILVELKEMNSLIREKLNGFL